MACSWLSARPRTVEWRLGREQREREQPECIARRSTNVLLNPKKGLRPGSAHPLLAGSGPGSVTRR